jgi:ubiquinone/menaquinone biosynthesis C-methylase UbiE
VDDKTHPTKQAVLDTFDRAAKNFGQRGPRHFEHFGRRLVELAGIAPGASVLDVATGRGAVLFPAVERVGPGGRISAIDLADGMVRETAADIEKRRLTNVDIRRMDADALDFPAEAFDWVLSGFALWFFARPDRALREFLRVLRPGGRVGISTWDRGSQLPYGFRRYIEKYLSDEARAADSARTRFDTSHELMSALEEAGFDAVDVRVDEATLSFPDEEALWATIAGGGMGRVLGIVGPSAGSEIKNEIFEAVRPTRAADGIPVHFRALFGFATKPK